MTVENTVSKRTVSAENVSKSEVDVLKSSLSEHEHKALNVPTIRAIYTNIDFINKINARMLHLLFRMPHYLLRALHICKLSLLLSKIFCFSAGILPKHLPLHGKI